ncbi:MAG: hypothetical protein EAZ09_06785 [Oscillatoriales cyanobacterium]|nr:MAG: hypothetical protein EAZ18_05760 [Oscillatoriales cyanobacterium]TAH23548.1 MAG: hypothetical protein EAZ09_06785 [Oscillatoriales cyanobacterium]
MINVCRFNCGNFRCLAPFFIVFSCGFWILGNSFSPAIAVDRITGAQAVENLKTLLGTPEDFQSDMKNSTQDFIADHFGSMAIAAAFGIAIRMRS